MRGGWSGFGMATVGIHPNDFDLNPNKIPTGGEVQIAEVDKKGVVRIKAVSEEELRKMNPWRRKAWSTRVRRWLKTMPEELLRGNPWEKGTRTKVKEWVKDNVGRRGEDGILWGRWKLGNEAELSEGEKEAEKKTHTPKNRDPPTSRKQMRKHRSLYM